VALDVTERIDTEQVLAPLLARARRLAAERGAPVLVSWSERVAAEDPIDVFAQAATASDRCLWLQPDADFALVGVGAAHVIEPTGPERFAAADAAWRALLDGALIVGDGPGPTVIGGFAFDPERPSTPRWCGFPDARLILPRQTLTLQGGECWRRVNVVVGDRHPSPPTPLPTLGEGSIEHDGMPSTQSAPDSPSPNVGRGGQGVRAVPRFLTAVAQAAAAVRRGDLEKVVLAREVRVEAEEPFDVEAALRRLRDAYPSCYVFAVARGERVFLGATPERLVRLDGRTVRVASLAGSIPRGATPEEDRELAAALLASAKDRAEHAVVVRAIRAALDGPCVEVETPDEPEILSVRNVHHLYTPVTARLRDGATLMDLVARLHPTPAVGGTPRAEALRYIREHEGLDRGWYAAPVGWMDASGQGEFAVALRSALVEGAEASLFAGCGIMGDSDPEREYAESSVKLRPMLAALGIEGAETE